MAGRRLPFVVLLPLLVAAGSAAADWLQLHDASRVETRGAWEVRGERVVFTLPNGTLGSLPASQVDLEASARVTREALAPKPLPTPTPRRPAVLTLTDADLAAASRGPARATDAAPGAAAADAGTGVAPKPNGPPGGGGELEVLNWSSRYDAETNETSLTGKIRNPGDDIRFGIRIEIAAFDRDGGLIAKSTVTPLPPGLRPGGTGAFVLRLPGAPSVARAEFAFTSDRATLRPSAESEPAAAAPTPTPAGPSQPAGEPSAATKTQLQLTWRPDPGVPPAVLAFVGEVTNPTATWARDIEVHARLLDERGAVIGAQRALLGTTALAPGQTTNFRVTFLGLSEFDRLALEARHRPLPHGSPQR